MPTAACPKFTITHYLFVDGLSTPKPVPDKESTISLNSHRLDLYDYRLSLKLSYFRDSKYKNTPSHDKRFPAHHVHRTVGGVIKRVVLSGCGTVLFKTPVSTIIS